MPSALFTPIQLRDLTLANRIVVSPLCQFSAVDGNATPWHVQNAGSYAISGAGLVILEATAVNAQGRITLPCLGLYSDDNEAALTALVKGARVFSRTPIGIQLSHAGRKASTRPTWELAKGHNLKLEEGAWPLVGPSAEPFGEGWPVPKELDAQGLSEVLDDFVAATRRAERCGFEMIEVHTAHGYLLHQFLSPLSNHRADRYGGTPEKRMQFPLEVIAAMRAAWPKGKPMGVRVTGRDFNDGGLELDDAVMFTAALKEIGIDYVTPSAGNVAPGMKLPKIEPGYMVPFAEYIGSRTGMPTMAVGLIVEPHQANEIIASGKADMVAIGRAFMDNPRWGWHAAAALGDEPHIPPPHNRVNPKVWPAFEMLHGKSGRLAEGMGHMTRE
jgi:2,4-dienoyl-CoA reductase-like NADH-dependent reductase (Old Yellow Enzyme family)